MRTALLIDFGSTETKVTAVDLDNEEILGTAQSYTTVASDINDGLEIALKKLSEKTGLTEYDETYACSSAAGGLRMIASGLVMELTAEAAKAAALGAGAKVLKTYAFNLNDADVEEIKEISPDIMLLVGGTDGGNRECILNNAKAVAGIDIPFPVIVAGNRDVAKQCADILSATHPCHICENVMPKLGKLNIEPTRKKIREVFLEKIVSAKGLSKANELISGIINPTPAAVMNSIKLLAEGYEDEPGIGELLAIDIGGATTDIYTICAGNPTKANTVFRGIPEPYEKRSVEADIGMRYCVNGIAEANGLWKVAKMAGMSEEKVREMLDYLSTHTDSMPEQHEDSFDWFKLDYVLASLAVETAVDRHAGYVEENYSMMGVCYTQYGKDLSNVHNIVVTGGILIHNYRHAQIASHALYDREHPMSLRPTSAKVFLDAKYIIASMGLLSEYHPKVALHLLKKELVCTGEFHSIDRK